MSYTPLKLAIAIEQALKDKNIPRAEFLLYVLEGYLQAQVDVKIASERAEATTRQEAEHVTPLLND